MWTNDGRLENVRNGASLYGSVDDVKGKSWGKIVGVEGGCKGVEFASFKRHRLYGFDDHLERQGGKMREECK